jgi:hypothetical protein
MREMPLMGCSPSQARERERRAELLREAKDMLRFPPAYIAAEAEKIRDGWSPEQRGKRYLLTPPDWFPPVCRVTEAQAY